MLAHAANGAGLGIHCLGLQALQLAASEEAGVALLEGRGGIDQWHHVKSSLGEMCFMHNQTVRIDGVTMNITSARAQGEWLRAAASAKPHAKLIYTAIGGGNADGDPFAMSGAPEVRKSTLTLNMTPCGERKGLSKQDLEGQLRAALDVLPSARVKVGFGCSSEKYVIVLAGEDGHALAEHVQKVERELRAIAGIGAVTSTSSRVRPELIVRPDFARAADLGVSVAAIADTLRNAPAGDDDQGLAKLNLAPRQVPIVVKLRADAR